MLASEASAVRKSRSTSSTPVGCAKMQGAKSECKLTPAPSKFTIYQAKSIPTYPPILTNLVNPNIPHQSQRTSPIPTYPINRNIPQPKISPQSQHFLSTPTSGIQNLIQNGTNLKCAIDIKQDPHILKQFQINPSVLRN